MTKKEIQRQADRAIRVAKRGTDAEIEALETEAGDSLSMIIDHLWSEAMDQGLQRLADRLEAAYDELTT